jgi:hypothetical protein
VILVLHITAANSAVGNSLMGVVRLFATVNVCFANKSCLFANKLGVFANKPPLFANNVNFLADEGALSGLSRPMNNLSAKCGLMSRKWTHYFGDAYVSKPLPHFVC